MREKVSAEERVREIRRKPRKKYSAEEKVRVVLEGLRGEEIIAALCRKEGIPSNLYYRRSKEFLEAGKKRLAGDTIKEQIRDLESDKKTIAEKQDRLLNLYLERKLPEATYENKNSELDKQLSSVRGQLVELRKRKEQFGQQELATAMVHTLRILSRSHRRFTEDQKTKVFRSLVCEAHIRDDQVSLELYVQPVENIWWKYRQKADSKRSRASAGEMVRVTVRRASVGQ